jgi:hypothetical protein
MQDDNLPGVSSVRIGRPYFREYTSTDDIPEEVRDCVVTIGRELLDSGRLGVPTDSSR